MVRSVLAYDLSLAVRVQSGEIRRFCSHMGRSQEAKIWVRKVFGPENSNGHGLRPVRGDQGAVGGDQEVLRPHGEVPGGQDLRHKGFFA